MSFIYKYSILNSLLSMWELMKRYHWELRLFYLRWSQCRVQSDGSGSGSSQIPRLRLRNPGNNYCGQRPFNITEWWEHYRYRYRVPNFLHNVASSVCLWARIWSDPHNFAVCSSVSWIPDPKCIEMSSQNQNPYESVQIRNMVQKRLIIAIYRGSWD